MTEQSSCPHQQNHNCVRRDKYETRLRKSYPEEERKLPAIEAHPEELRLDPLLLDDVVIVRCLHFLSQNNKHAKES